jgi:histidine transport system permease protein
MFLEGYGQQLWDGTLETIQLALFSLALAFVVGLVGAVAKLSGNPWFAVPATIYTTLIRGVPDLVLMLLLFYSFQDLLNRITDALNQPQFDIDPFIAGICVSGSFMALTLPRRSAGRSLQFPRGNSKPEPLTD